MKYEITATAAAPAEYVWQALIDIESWPTWMSSYRSVRRLDDGPFRVGCRAEVAQPGLKQSTYRVTSLWAGREFTWESRAPGISTRARHVVRPQRDGGTHISLAVMQAGPLAVPTRILLGRKIRRFLAIEASGLVRAGQARSTTGEPRRA